MTPEEFTNQLPPFANDPARTKPPFVFKNMSVRVFPLRASLDALQQVCDSYLNFVPPEVGRFRAVMPYVMLSILDYGQISEAVDSIGWFAQAEVYFGIPIEWYKLIRGRWVFHDWAVITPFIFVDDDFSAPLGRSVFGFPKTLARVTKTESAWMRDPVAPVTLARVETRVFPELYKGKRLESRVVLEVERAAPMANFRVPPDPTSPIMPWMVAGNFAQAMAGFGRDAMRIAQSMRIFEPNPGTHPAFGPEMMNRMLPALMPSGKGFVLNSLNLKQFRNAGHPFHFCYQALTNGGMETTAFNGGGLLGEERTALGDSTGGYKVKLQDYSSLPIARTLGLEVSHRRPGNGVDEITLLPVMPFWANLNVKYLAGTNLAWRTADGIWHGGNGSRLDLSQKPLDDDPENDEMDDSTLFNTTVASAVDDAVTGPFQFTGTTVRVLPLLAKRRKLEEFLARTYINDQLSDAAVSKYGEKKYFRLSLWSRPAAQVNKGGPIGGDHAYVYVTASSFGGVTSKTNDIGDWAKYELSFLIPVKFECKAEGGEWEIQGVGLVPAYSFVDDSTAANSRTEVLGIPTLRANFMRPESVWLQEGEANFGARQTVLRVDAEVFTAFHVGQPASILPLLEIRSKDDGTGTGEWESQTNPANWAEMLRLELGTKNGSAAVHHDEYNLARSLALEILGHRVPVAFYTLKQLPDVADPGKACYQALVRVSRVFDEIFDLREIEETLRIRIHDYPSLALVETLGIIANTVPDETGLTYETQAIRPFYIQATIREELGERILWRTGGPEWKFGDTAFKGLLGDQGKDTFTVDPKALKMQDQGDPCRMGSLMYQSLQRRRDAPNAVTKEAARAALLLIDPQMVIESVLSREWGNFDEHARWRRGREEVTRVRKLTLSSEGSAFAALKLKDPDAIRGAVSRFINASQPLEADVREIQAKIQRATDAGREMFADCEEQLYRDLVDPKPHTSGRRSVRLAVEPMIENMKRYTKARLEMEDHFSLLSAWSISRMLGASDPISPAELAKVSRSLLKAMQAINSLDVVGEPSPHNNIDTQIGADMHRLGGLLGVLEKALRTSSRSYPGARSPKNKALPDQEPAAHAVRFMEQYREAVHLATRKCNVQRNALFNKLSRAYQKPDFCIRRDSVGLDADRLLPLSASWDPDWYAGNDIQVEIFGENKEFEPE